MFNAYKGRSGIINVMPGQKKVLCRRIDTSRFKPGAPHRFTSRRNTTISRDHTSAMLLPPNRTHHNTTVTMQTVPVDLASPSVSPLSDVSNSHHM